MAAGLSVLIALAVVAIPALWLMSTFNGLVTLRNRYKNGFSQIDVQLKRRYDLIPNLVETAKAYMAHERQTLEAVIAARNQAVTAGQRAAASPGDPGAMGALAQAEGALGASLGRLIVLSESYPQLKADSTMGQLMEELSSTENKVAYARQAFNDFVMAYNTAREVFPANLVSGLFGFNPADSLRIEDPKERAAPQVRF
jgi:LemA protein